jgi:hypothetical protein
MRAMLRRLSARKELKCAGILPRASRTLAIAWWGGAHPARNRSGKPLRESKVLRNVLQPAAEEAGLGRVTWHQFRHIHSSLLNDLKVPVKVA